MERKLRLAAPYTPHLLRPRFRFRLLPPACGESDHASLRVASVRKQIRIRPGYTPQEDVQRFRGTRQQALDSRAMPIGHIIGWTPPPLTPQGDASKLTTKSAKKNEKRKEKRKEKREEVVRESWDSDEGEDGGAVKVGTVDHSTSEQTPPTQTATPGTSVTSKAKGKSIDLLSTDATDPVNADAIADQLEKLEMK